MSGPERRRRLQRAAGTARARPALRQATLPLPLPIAPTVLETAALLKALIKHLLFQRAQIPYLYDDLLRAAQAAQEAEAADEEAAAEQGGGGPRRRRRRVPISDKRLLKFLARCEELLASIDAALAACGVPPRAFVLLGASTAKPREVYEVLLPQPAAAPAAAPAAGEGCAAAAADGGAAAVAEASSASQQQQAVAAPGRARPTRQQRLCQLAVRQLVVASADLPEGSAHTVPCKLFVLLESGSMGDDGSDDGGGGDADVPVQLQPPPPGFGVKRQFRLSMRKGLHVRLLLGQRRASEAAAEQRGEEQLEQAAGPAASGGSGGSGSSCFGGSQAVTVDLSQLPDADGPEEGGVTTDVAPAASKRGSAVSSTDGSTWFVARAVPTGLNSGGGGGTAASFEGGL